jgi:hypothetical protein
MNVYSPVFGIVDKISNNSINIYLRGPYDEKQNPHGIFSPISGLLSNITFINIKKR